MFMYKGLGTIRNFATGFECSRFLAPDGGGGAPAAEPAAPPPPSSDPAPDAPPPVNTGNVMRDKFFNQHGVNPQTLAAEAEESLGPGNTFRFNGVDPAPAQQPVPETPPTQDVRHATEPVQADPGVDGGLHTPPQPPPEPINPLDRIRALPPDQQRQVLAGLLDSFGDPNLGQLASTIRTFQPQAPTPEPEAPKEIAPSSLLQNEEWVTKQKSDYLNQFKRPRIETDPETGEERITEAFDIDENTAVGKELVRNELYRRAAEEAQKHNASLREKLALQQREQELRSQQEQFRRAEQDSRSEASKWIADLPKANVEFTDAEGRVAFTSKDFAQTPEDVRQIRANFAAIENEVLSYLTARDQNREYQSYIPDIERIASFTQQVRQSNEPLESKFRKLNKRFAIEAAVLHRNTRVSLLAQAKGPSSQQTGVTPGTIPGQPPKPVGSFPSNMPSAPNPAPANPPVPMGSSLGDLNSAMRGAIAEASKTGPVTHEHINSFFKGNVLARQ